MALALGKTRLKVRFDSVFEDSAVDVGEARSVVGFEKIFDWTNGTGANQANMLFKDKRQLAASGSEVLDLAGSLTDNFGNTMTFVRVSLVIVFALPTNTNDVQLQRDATNGAPVFMAASDGVAIPPGGIAVIYFGDDATDAAIGAGSSDEIILTNSAGGSAVDYEIIILGADA